MNTRLVNAVADVIARSQANGKKTPAGWAMDLESAQLVQSPETAAEMERLVKERDAFRDQRNAVFETNAQLHARVEAAGLARIEAENETRTANRELKALRARVAGLEAELRRLNTLRGDAAQLVERERQHGEECVDIGDLEATLMLGAGDEPGPDALTKTFVPTQALQLEDPHDSPLHHSYRVGRDLPETGGQS